MIIGVPKEIKNNENRVALTPAGVAELKKHGHAVYVQATAGIGSGFSDAEYSAAGATMLPTIEEVYGIAEMIIKVKEPIEQEYKLIKKDQLLFTYFHFASSEPLTHAMIERGAVCLAYETVEKADRSLPLLVPMSEVAGRMAIQEGAKYLEKPLKGRGILLGGVPGVRPANVLVLGGGIVGTQAAKMAAGLGARVVIMDVSLPRLRYLSDIMPQNVTTIMSNDYNIREAINSADLIVGAVLIPGAKAPHLITRDMLKLMRPGTVMVDVAIDQGGCFETSRITNHSEPTFEKHGVTHYCVPNIASRVSRTASFALSNTLSPLLLEMGDRGGVADLIRTHAGFRNGVYMFRGILTNEVLGKVFDLQYKDINLILPGI